MEERWKVNTSQGKEGSCASPLRVQTQLTYFTQFMEYGAVQYSVLDSGMWQGKTSAPLP